MKGKVFFGMMVMLMITTHFSSAQVCGNDSIVFQNIRETGDLYIHIITHVDSFNLQNGLQSRTTSTSVNGAPPVISYSQGAFVRNIVSYNGNNDTAAYFAMQGTGLGFDSLRKIVFTYDVSGLPLSRNEYTFPGGIANLEQSETWTYNVNNRITSYLLTGSAGNIIRKNYFYTGNQGDSVIFQVWTGGAWVNDMKYLFTYNGSLRDSIYMQKWDGPSSSWIDSLSSIYDNILYPSHYCAFFSRLDTIGGMTENHSYYIDTLDNVIRDSLINQSSLYFVDTKYDYFHSRLKIVQIHDYMYSSSWADEGIRYNYNSSGLLVSQNYTGFSIAGTIRFNSSDYDSLQHITNYHSEDHSNTNDIIFNDDYTYSSSDSISFSYIPQSDYFGYQCQNNFMPTIPVLTGGCGPYSFSWSPSTYLSSDTIANPTIYLPDTIINYTITVTDTTGHSATTTFTAYPDLTASITYDTTNCPGCPVVLNTIHSLPNPSYQWFRNDTIIPGADLASYTATTSGIYTVQISSSACTILTDSVQLNVQGLTRMMGMVFLDLDSNCVFTAGDRGLYRYGLTPFLIKLERGGYTGYIIPDSTGSFNFPIDTGNFLLSVINPSALYTAACPDSGIISVNVPAFGDTISGINLVLKPLFDCHRLGVYVNSTIFRVCRIVDIHVNYFNEGSIDENFPVLNVAIPPELINVTTSQPYTILANNVYSFSLPPLPIATFGSIDIQATVDCNTVDLPNATICLDAEIKPVDFCSLQPDSSWDGSNIRVSAFCQNDSNVCFTIWNDSSIPAGDMDTSSVWRLYEDNSIIQQGTFILNAGRDTTLCFPSDGKTFRLEADQLPGFPLNNYPSASIERCGILPVGGNYSLGQILLHPVNNALPFYNSYCGIIRNAYDPNVKSVQPTGAYTPENQRLKYRIDFQNTGNDTAFKVVIVDRISSMLDITSVQLLSSSHPCVFRIDNRDFIWEFDPIALPDSNSDELNSRGYVEFSIKPDSALPVGSTIVNRANIYFGINAPIVTSAVSKTICETETLDFSIMPIGSPCPGQPFSMIADIHNNLLVNYKWYMNGLYITNNDTLFRPNFQPGTTIKLLLTKRYSCTLPDTVSRNYVLTYNYPTITFGSGSLISSPGLSYQWYLDSIAIPGADSIAYIPVASGNYMVQTTDSNGCTAFSNNYAFINTLINYVNREYTLFPNPADEFVTISGLSSPVKLQILDLTGKLIREMSSDEKTVRVFTGNLPAGIYMIQLRTDKSISNLMLNVLHED